MIYRINIEPGDSGTEVFVTAISDSSPPREISTIDVIQVPDNPEFKDVMEGVLRTLVKDAIIKDLIKQE